MTYHGHYSLVYHKPAAYATVPKHEAKERKIWDAQTIFKAIELCKDPRLKLCLNLAFSCTLRIGELLALTWDCVDISEEAISENRAYVFINKQVERVSKEAVEELDSKEVILIFPSQRKNNKTVRVLKTPKTDTSERKVYIPGFVAQCLIDIKKEQDEVFHSLRHTSVTYKLKLSDGDIKAVQGDSGHAQADMVTEVYGHIIDEDRRKNAERMEKKIRLPYRRE